MAYTKNGLCKREVIGEMCEVIERNRAEGRTEGRAEGRAEGIKSLMDSLCLSAEEAMKALKIPPSEYPRHLAML